MKFFDKYKNVDKIKFKELALVSRFYILVTIIYGLFSATIVGVILPTFLFTKMLGTTFQISNVVNVVFMIVITILLFASMKFVAFYNFNDFDGYWLLLVLFLIPFLLFFGFSTDSLASYAVNYVLSFGTVKELLKKIITFEGLPTE